MVTIIWKPRRPRNGFAYVYALGILMLSASVAGGVASVAQLEQQIDQSLKNYYEQEIRLQLQNKNQVDRN